MGVRSTPISHAQATQIEAAVCTPSATCMLYVNGAVMTAQRSAHLSETPHQHLQADCLRCGMCVNITCFMIRSAHFYISLSFKAALSVPH